MRADIDNAELLESHFGYWPSFHDAEVWRLAHERTMAGFDIEVTIHAFEITSELDSRGYYRLRKHVRVTLRFVDCHDAFLQAFNHQNVLSRLSIEAAETGCPRPIRVVLATSYGLEGELFCDKVQVIEAVPWVPPCGVYASQTAT